METTMNPGGAISRGEIKKMVEEILTEKVVPERLREDVVQRGEFRLLLWMGAFAMTAILGGFVFLYTGITDLRVTMEKEHANLRVTMEKEHANLRVTMEKGHASLRADIKSLDERLGRIETILSK